MNNLIKPLLCLVLLIVHEFVAIDLRVLIAADWTNHFQSILLLSNANHATVLADHGDFDIAIGLLPAELSSDV